MDWAKDGEGNRNPIVVINGKKGLDAIKVKADANETVRLDATKTSDPEGDAITCKWRVLPESGSYQDNIEITNADKPQASLTLPANAGGHTIHVICEVTDNGSPALKAYRRVIISVTK